jgi:hypothetical protein
MVRRGCRVAAAQCAADGQGKQIISDGIAGDIVTPFIQRATRSISASLDDVLSLHHHAVSISAKHAAGSTGALQRVRHRLRDADGLEVRAVDRRRALRVPGLAVRLEAVDPGRSASK